MVDKEDLRAVHWELGNTKVNYESETSEKILGEGRDREVRAAIRARQTPESLELGKLLRQSHIQLSHRPDREVAKTESKMRFVPQNGEPAKSYADIIGGELQKTNIDLAVGDPKSGKEWQSVLKSEMSKGEDVKFKAEKPKGFEALGEELRKSSVLFHAGRHDFRTDAPPVQRSETKRQFEAKPLSPTVGFAESNGKELRKSNIDMACGATKSTASWRSQQHAIMADNYDKKYKCEKTEGFEFLGVELRKTNVTLGTDRVVYGTEGVRRPLRDDRNAHPAGHVPGL